MIKHGLIKHGVKTVKLIQNYTVHLILGANDFAKVRTGERLPVGRRGDPVAEITRFCWALMSPRAETDLSSVYLFVNSTVDYER